MDEESVKLDVSIEIARDAHRASLIFWKQWLWQSVEAPAIPSRFFCDEVAVRYGIPCAEVRRQWLEWYDLLTSWDLGAVLAGGDVHVIARPYGLSHRRV